MASRVTRVEGLEGFRRRMLETIPAAAREKLKAANQKNAEEFAALVRRIVPKSPEDDGVQLASTVEVRDGTTETAVEVTIGGPAAPYPFHLEHGHAAADGSHVPGKPFWNPARRVLRKKTNSRRARALNAALKAT